MSKYKYTLYRRGEVFYKGPAEKLEFIKKEFPGQLIYWMQDDE